MTQEQLKILSQTRRVAHFDACLRKKALTQSRHFFSKDAQQAPKCMQAVWLKKHNELYRHLLNDPRYDARYFFQIKERG